ncbi:MAG: hypothetical protein ACR2NM_17395 [Bythopirellula sp.]
MPKPRALDETKRREICALVTAGMRLHKVAKYVGCCAKTIHREREANPEFDKQMRRAEMAADLNPLEAIRRAAGTHWRAAAWMLERDDRRESKRDRSRRDKQASVSRRDLALLSSELIRAMRREVDHPILMMRIEARIDEVFNRCLGSGPSAEQIAERDDERLWQSIDFLDSSYDNQDAAPDDAPATLPSVVEELHAEIATECSPPTADSIVPSSAHRGTKQAANCPRANQKDPTKADQNRNREGQYG